MTDAPTHDHDPTAAVAAPPDSVPTNAPESAPTIPPARPPDARELLAYRERFQPLLQGPPQHTADPHALLAGYLDWYRERLLATISAFTDTQRRTRVAPLTWSPLGLVQHLGHVERRWLEWGFLGHDIHPTVPGPASAEWDPATPTADVLATYTAQIARSRRIIDAAHWDQPAAVGGRFPTAELAPPLGRILAHLYQEYARHLGQLDIVCELLTAHTGE